MRRRAESKVNGNTDPASLLPVIDEEATATFYEFFDDIFEGDDAGGAAVFIADDG